MAIISTRSLVQSDPINSSSASPSPPPSEILPAAPDDLGSQLSTPSTLEKSSASNPSPQVVAAKSNKSKKSVLQPSITDEDRSQPDEKLRPQRLTDYIGQKELKEILLIAIQAAQSRKESLDHLLLYGPPGLGKTTLSLILAAEMGVSCKITSAPALERPRDIVGLLMGLQPGDVLFIDEIHRLPRVTE